MKRQVYDEYGVTSHGSGDYEVDHLIPFELGDSNSNKNLWPESHRTLPWNAQVKDRLEGKLHELVMQWTTGPQNGPRGNRIKLDRSVQIVRQSESPISWVARQSAAATPLNRDQVWVNTKRLLPAPLRRSKLNQGMPIFGAIRVPHYAS